MRNWTKATSSRPFRRGENDLRNCWRIIDYNHQSLDGVVCEGLFKQVEQIFDAFGLDVVRVKYGHLQRAAFDEAGGDKLRQWIDDCPTSCIPR